MIYIDVKDFIPEPLEGDIYEGFETLVEKANVWLEKLSGVVHISLQSVLVQKEDRKFISLFQNVKQNYLKKNLLKIHTLLESLTFYYTICVLYRMPGWMYLGWMGSQNALIFSRSIR